MPQPSDFPSNSNTDKRAASKATKPGKDEKKVESVVTGTATRRKKPLTKKFTETFFGGGSLKDVGSYVVFDVLVPAAQDMIMDATVGGLERKFYPDGPPAGRRGSRAGRGNSRSHVAYSRITGDPRGRAGRADEPRGLSRRARATHDFDDIILPSRVEADVVVERMFDILDQYEQVTVADLYDLCDITSEPTDNSYGWEDLRGTRVVSVGGGFLIDLPRTEPLR